MSGFEAVNHSAAILHHRGLVSEYALCLPTPVFFNSVITLINEGKIVEATAAINSCEHVVAILEDDLNEKDIEWYSGIISRLKEGIPTKQSHLSHGRLKYTKPT